MTTVPDSTHVSSVVFLCVNKGDAPSVIKRYWDLKGYTMQAVTQEGTEVSDAFGVLGFPTVYVIGPDGMIRYRSASFEPQAIRKALAK